MKTIIITGGTSGIGLDIANYFYKKNFNIAIGGIGNGKIIRNLKKNFNIKKSLVLPLDLTEKNSASIQDILLLFIYLELGAVVGIYFKTNHMPVRFLIYVAITALTRMLLEYLNNWHNAASNSNFHYDILIICGGIVLLSISIIVLRYSSFNYPSDKK